MKLHISVSPAELGGGSNTFAYNMTRWCRDQGLQLTPSLRQADAAIVIAHKVALDELAAAKRNGCLIIHRLDEHVVPGETGYRREKHETIREISRLADVVVFQSEFVKENMLDYVGPNSYRVILNGADPAIFRPADSPGDLIGHVTWGVGAKKRLDLVQAEIKARPNETFLLVGRHGESGVDFSGPNVSLLPPQEKRSLADCYRRLKVLYYPSELDPCPNTVIEAILCGVPVCYNPVGGSRELVQDCGEPLDRFDRLLSDPDTYRKRCLARTDLYFDRAAKEYMSLWTRARKE